MNVSWPVLLLIGGTLIAALLILVMPFPHFRRTTNVPADRRPTPIVFRDDDRYWSGNIIYSNPDDPAMFVPKRYGLGWTLNFGNSRARLLMFAILLIPPVVLILTLLISGPAPIGCHPSGCHPFP